MRKVVLLFSSFLLAQVVPAQKPTRPAVTYRAPAVEKKLEPFQSLTSSFGDVQVLPYGPNIYKIIVHATGDRNADHISDAVIAKPSAQGVPANPVAALGADSFSVGKLLFTTYYDGNNKGFRVFLKEGEKIWGGGERAVSLNRRGYRLNLNNNPWYGYGEGADNLNYSVPFVTSSAGYGLFFDNPSRGYIDIGKTEAGALLYGTPSGEWSMYVLLGNPAEVLASYHKLTGTQPLPPRWAFGNLMSRFGYTSEAQVKDVLAKMKRDSVPVEAVIFDLFWFGDSIKGTMGNLDWVNKKKWPNPAGMIAGFKKEGINTILITEPFLVETSKNYIASKPYLAVDSVGKPYYLTDFYFGKGGLVDIFRKDAQGWFWSFYRRQMQLGVEGWWGDLGEPERHPANMYHNLKDLGFSKRLYKADEVHNIYGHTWTKMLYEFYAKEYPNKRLFSLNRSGFAGSQRFGIFPWTGDVSRSWGGLRAQLPTLLGMTMSGVPYVHSDAGGFAGGQGDGELYVRWLQFAAFTPIFRPHGTALYEVDKAAFSFPSEAALIDTPWRNYAKEAIALRYSFLPYNYSLAYLQAKEGKPLMAPLYYYHPTDTIAANVQDEYYWGPSLLVAPVLTKGASARRVYLPGGQWLDRSGRLIEGHRWIDVPVTIGAIPWFIRAGSITPGQRPTPGANTASEKGATPFVIYVPADQPASFDWYLDDGASKGAMATGKYTLLHCSGRQQGSTVRLQLTPTNTLYASDKLVAQVLGLDEQPKGVTVNGKPVPLVAEGTAPAKGTTALWDAAHGALSVLLEGGMKTAVTIEVQR
jgi:oligosaccharide 4-alpha-D-glucosyltransferase